MKGQFLTGVACTLSVLLAGCASGAPRGPALKRNREALATIPPPRSARLVRTETIGNHAPDTSEGPIVSWSTIRHFTLDRPMRSGALILRVDRALQSAGWKLGIGGGFYRNARRGSSCLHVLTGPEPPTSGEEPIATWTATTGPDPPVAESDPAEELARGILFKVTEC